MVQHESVRFFAHACSTFLSLSFFRNHIHICERTWHCALGLQPQSLVQHGDLPRRFPTATAAFLVTPNHNGLSALFGIAESIDGQTSRSGSTWDLAGRAISGAPEQRMFEKLERPDFLADVKPLLTAEEDARFPKTPRGTRLQPCSATSFG
jgi:hypothetical protein